MMRLFYAELYKLLRQKRTYFGIGAILVIEAIVLAAAYFQGREIIDILLDNLKRGFYFKGELLNGNLMVYLILNSLWFNLPLILMMLCSALVTMEYKDKTIQTLLLQPVSRTGLILAKYAVSVLLTIVLVFLLAITAFIMSYGVFGKGDLIVYLDQLNFFPHAEAMERLIKAFISGSFQMIFYAVVSVTIGIWFRDTLITWILCLLFLVVSNVLLKLETGWGLFDRWFFAKLGDTWQYYFYYEVPLQKIWVNNALIVLYSLVVCVLGCLYFTKKEL